MSAAEVTKVREAVLERIREDFYGTLDGNPELSIKAMVADTTLDVLEVTEVTDNHRLIIHLVTQALENRRCEVCRGRLIGREIAHDTCGHCGGRSINPTTREEVTQ